MAAQATRRLTVGSNGEAVLLFGSQDANLRYLAERCPAKIVARGNEVTITGEPEAVARTERVLQHLSALARQGTIINPATIDSALTVAEELEAPEELAEILGQPVYVTARGRAVRPKTLGQYRYLEAIRSHDVVFAIGPAGTGKTYLAVTMAVAALRDRRVERIVLARPAVEAGEKLGFLPGDLQEKVNPYLRPLYDALFDLLSPDTAQRYMERNLIEIAPLAYMRGRTLDDAFIILDEAQNTTGEQMKMFLTRLGVGSKAVITGDITQIDLPPGRPSGLVEAQDILREVEGIAFVYLTAADVVRHRLVQKIIDAYAQRSPS
ncbi:MAG: PhoH family protein [Clostridia bacterium]|nr:PhoH family protein [Clostridia bacterium]